MLRREGAGVLQCVPRPASACVVPVVENSSEGLDTAVSGQRAGSVETDTPFLSNALHVSSTELIPCALCSVLCVRLCGVVLRVCGCGDPTPEVPRTGV